jgi:hypothetical protein
MRERAKLAGRSLEFKSEREKGDAVTDARTSRRALSQSRYLQGRVGGVHRSFM